MGSCFKLMGEYLTSVFLSCIYSFETYFCSYLTECTKCIIYSSFFCSRASFSSMISANFFLLPYYDFVKTGFKGDLIGEGDSLLELKCFSIALLKLLLFFCLSSLNLSSNIDFISCIWLANTVCNYLMSPTSSY